jgi:protein phosphatase
VKSYTDLDVGVATHTGCVRRTNEDDYLLLFPDDPEWLDRRGRVVALADGMGGVTGGAEASRTATRAFAQSFLAADDALDEPEARMHDGFRRACRRVFELSRESPSLRGMGTTLTVLNLVGERFVVGHIGDSRCYLLRDGQLDQLTEDHALRGRENRLTRCVGGGRDSEQPDVQMFDLRPDDCFLLASDGLWDTVPEDEMRRVLESHPPQGAADELIRLANTRGGPDNVTAIVVRVAAVADASPSNGERGHLRELRLPAGETWQAPALPRRSQSLRAPLWPWLLLFASAVLGGLAVAKANGLDLLDQLVRLFR